MTQALDVTRKTMRNAARGSSAMRATRSARCITIGLAIGAALAGCSPTISKHGNLLSQSDLQQVQTGTSKEQVKTALGSPATTSTVGGDAYYYISTTREQRAFMKPKVTERRVVAVYFDEFGTVNNVARYGLKDGKVFDYITRETPTHARDLGVIQKIFRGIGTPNTPPGSQIGKGPPV
ncbi:MAG: outer membrane protein assembly factor BamE [Pseudomonadota bacterium]